MTTINEYVLIYRDSFRDYLYGHVSFWVIYVLCLVGIALTSYYLIFFKKSDRQKQLTVRSTIILNIAVAIVAAYEMTAPYKTSMWFLVQDALISLVILDLIIYLSEKFKNKNLFLRVVLFLFCFLGLIVFVTAFILGQAHS